MTTPETNPASMRIAFLHPDLGIGGAERLIVDAAIALQNYGHTVHLFTSHHDEDHSFDETKQTKSCGKLKVISAGDWLPRSLFGRFSIVFAILRGIFLSLFLLWNWGEHNPLIKRSHGQFTANNALLGEYDVIITDQLSIYNLFLLFTSSRTVFYCHFPDQLLSKKEGNPLLNQLKQLYRIPINSLEQITTGMADTILVNSAFTGKTFARTFTSLDESGIKPSVLYPSIQMKDYDNNFTYDEAVLNWWHWAQDPANAEKINQNNHNNGCTTIEQDQHSNSTCPEITKFCSAADFAQIESIPRTTCLFVSINRFERKKEIEQAIYGFSQLKSKIDSNSIKYPTPSALNKYLPFTDAKLLIAGGYDHQVLENHDYQLYLTKVARTENLTTSIYPDTAGSVIFLLSFTQTQRTSLLRRAQAIVYTPQNEHFGIVPIESMYSSRTVLAHCSGGPLESIQHGVTGFLCTKWDNVNNIAMECISDGFEQNGAENQTIVKNVKNSTNQRQSGDANGHEIKQSDQITAEINMEAGKMTFGDAMEVIYAGKNNMEFCVNPRANAHAINKFSIQVFAKHWNDAVVAAKAIPEAQTHWLRQFVNNFGTQPFTRIVVLGNMTITILVVMVYSIFGKKNLFNMLGGAAQQQEQ